MLKVGKLIFIDLDKGDHPIMVGVSIWKGHVLISRLSIFEYFEVKFLSIKEL